MRFTAILLALIAAITAAPGAVTLRYVFTPGQAEHYSVEETSVASHAAAGGQPIEESRTTARGVLERRVLAVDQKNGVIEVRFVSGTQESRTPAGATRQVLPPSNQRTTQTPLGRILHTEHVAEDGHVDAAPQPLDGMSFSLPARPVSPGATWNETVNVAGMDSRPISLRATSTFVRTGPRMGHPCAWITVIFSGAAQLRTPDGRSAVESMSGKATTCLAIDLGREMASSATFTVTVGSPDGGQRVLEFTVRQTLVK